MEARDAPDKIRPLPPDLAGDATPEGPPPPDRRWVPIAVAAGALVFFGVLAGLLGSAPTTTSGPNEAEPPPTTLPGLGAPPPPPTTTTRAPQTLRERIPILERSLTVIYQGDDGTSTRLQTWPIGAIEPSEATSSGGRAEAAMFDTSFAELAWVTTGRHDTLWLGAPPQGEPAWIDISGAAWHATTPLALAWLARDPADGTIHLYRATALPTGLEQLTDLGPLPEGSELVGWGDWGFALNVPPPSLMRQWRIPDPTGATPNTVFQPLAFTIILDDLGVETAALVGTARATGPDGHLVIQPAPEAYRLALDGGLDVVALGLQTEPIVVGRDPQERPFALLAPDLTPTDVGFAPASPATTFVFTPDGAHVTAAGAIEGRFAMVTEAVDGTQRRITSVAGADALIGFSRDGKLLVLHDRSGGGLTFHDWNRGASWQLPFPSGSVLAVDV